jgi:hypothetical protein
MKSVERFLSAATQLWVFPIGFIVAGLFYEWTHEVLLTLAVLFLPPVLMDRLAARLRQPKEGNDA